MGELSYQRAPALLISFIIFIAVALSYLSLILIFKILTYIPNITYKIWASNALNLLVLFGCYIAGFALICTMLGKDFDSKVIGYLSTYYFTIVLITFVLLLIFPYFINIFENTIGYLFLQFFRKENAWLNPFKFDLDLSDKIAPESYKSTNKDFLITVMDILNDKTWLPNNTISDEIKKCLYAKHFVGHFVWVYFACLICTFTTIKTIAYNS